MADADDLAPGVRAGIDDALKAAGVPGEPEGEYTIVHSQDVVPGEPLHIHLVVQGTSSLVNLQTGPAWRRISMVHRFRRTADGRSSLIALHAVACDEQGPVEVLDVWKAPA